MYLARRCAHTKKVYKERLGRKARHSWVFWNVRRVDSTYSRSYSTETHGCRLGLTSTRDSPPKVSFLIPYCPRTIGLSSFVHTVIHIYMQCPQTLIQGVVSREHFHFPPLYFYIDTSAFLAVEIMTVSPPTDTLRCTTQPQILILCP